MLDYETVTGKPMHKRVCRHTVKALDLQMAYLPNHILGQPGHII